MPGSQDYFGSISDTRDRRRHSRQTTALNYVRLGETNGGILLNVSEEGLAFTAAEPLAGEFILRLRFQLAEKAEWIEASGRIVWLNDSKKGAGVEFIDISNAGREQIRQWIDSKKPYAETQEPVSAARKTRKESEVTPFPAHKFDAHKNETQYEIVEPHLRKMFPSESVLEAETARPAPPPQVVAFNETQAESRAQFFPSETGEDCESAVTSVPPIERQPIGREVRYAESLSESQNSRTAEPRFRHAVQIETLPETNQIHQQEKESAQPENARLMEQSDEAPEITADSVIRTNQLQRGDSAPRAARVPNFGYQTSPSELSSRVARVPSFGYQATASTYEQSEDWTNWVDPAANPHRGKLGFVVVGVLLVVAAFAIGMALGHGSLDGFVESVRQYIPDKYQQAPTANISAAESAPPAPKVEKTKTDTPTQAQSDTSSAQTSETSATPSPAAPPTQPAASSTTSDTGTHPEAASSEAEVAGASGRAKATATKSETTPVLVSAAGSGNGPLRLTSPETAVSASSSVAISSQATVLVPRAAGADAAQEAKRLQPGTLVLHVEPQYSKRMGHGEVEIVKLVATIGENGLVTNVQRISGPPLFASAAISAIREWKYSPTLLDGSPVKTEEKITVAFRSR
jgi:periplasmic protein TonB